MTAFTDCLAILLKEEGGFVNNPHDPGGITNLGVTAKTWAAWTGTKPTEADMRALTPERVGPLYRTRYWNAVLADCLPPALALIVFDFAVNAGPARAAKMLQGVVGASQDGSVGPATLKALQALAGAKGLAEVVRSYMNARRAYYRSLGTFGTFGKGWLARCDRIETNALRMVK